MKTEEKMVEYRKAEEKDGEEVAKIYISNYNIKTIEEANERSND